MSLKEIINKAVVNVRAGKGSDSDKAIYMLLEHNKRHKQEIDKLKQDMEDMESNCNKEGTPIHLQKPWYMKE